MIIEIDCCKSTAPTPSDLHRRRLEAFVDSLKEQYQIPGVVIGIVEGNEDVVTIERGISNLSTGLPIDRLDAFRIASITKTFVSSLILLLVDEDSLKLSDTLSVFLPDIPNSDKITIRMLMNHTAGIHDILESERIEYNFVNNPLKVWTKDEIYDSLVSSPPDFEPGTKFNYSNGGYLVLGFLIENITKNTLEDELNTRILSKYQLSSTLIPSNESMPNISSKGYFTDDKSDELVDITEISPSLTWSAGSMVSTLSDLLSWAEIFYKAPFLSKTTRKERMTFVHVRALSKHDWGEDVFYGAGVLKIGQLIGHTGGIYGYNTAMFYLPSQDASIVALMNNCNQVKGHATEMVKGIASIYYPSSTIPYGQ